jgi:hypothetical protein
MPRPGGGRFFGIARAYLIGHDNFSADPRRIFPNI